MMRFTINCIDHQFEYRNSAIFRIKLYIEDFINGATFELSQVLLNVLTIMFMIFMNFDCFNRST